MCVTLTRSAAGVGDGTVLSASARSTYFATGSSYAPAAPVSEDGARGGGSRAVNEPRLPPQPRARPRRWPPRRLPARATRRTRLNTSPSPARRRSPPVPSHLSVLRHRLLPPIRAPEGGHVRVSRHPRVFPPTRASPARVGRRRPRRRRPRARRQRRSPGVRVRFKSRIRSNLRQ